MYDFDTATTEMGVANDNVPLACRSEVLCFMQQKSKLLAFDQLAKICCDFCRKDELLAAQYN
jgi:hypothetical protein